MNDNLLNSIMEHSKVSTDEFSDVNITDKNTQDAIQKLVENKINTAIKSAIKLDNDDQNEDLILAMIEVTVKPEGGTGFDKVAEKICKYPEVRSVFLMSGGNDLTIIIEALSLRQVSQFVSEKLSVLASINSTDTKLVLKKYKENGETFNTNKKDDERLIISP